MPNPFRGLFLLASACVLAIAPVAAVAAAPVPPVAAGDLADLSLEDLMDLEVTSVSKKAEKLSDSPAAIYVITNEDIRRSGATSVPEALRMVPGVQVAQISANRWAISARGFNGEFANKLLVLIDGRSVYTPLFSGVFWDVQDVMLEDVARIEVIRGPGATLWGANAVNGVINVITRSAAETQGALVVSGAGSNERAFGSMRWGGKGGEGLYYRVYGKYFDRDNFQTPEGDNAEDDWHVGRGGFRVDWEIDDNDGLTFQGDYYRGEVGERHLLVESIVPTVTPLTSDNSDIEGWNAQARWTHRFSETSELSLQSYFDRTKRDIEFASETRDTVDLDFQHTFALGERHDLVWGTGYRWSQDRTRGSQRVFFVPDKRDYNLFSAFVQDQITLLEDRVYLTLGSKFEHNDFTGFEYQPSGRLLYKPHDQHTLWASVARAVRTPSRAGEDVSLTQEVAPPGGPPAFLPLVQVTHLDGDSDLESEEMVAYEAGYRFTPSPRFSTDVALFYNDYHKIRSIEFAGLDFATVPGAALINNVFDNRFDGEAYGAEVATRWDVLPWWQLSGSYSYMTLNLNSRGSSDITTEASTEGAVPTHMFNIRSFVDLPANFEFDTMLYYVENLPSGGVPSYTRLDLRIGWRPRDDLRLSVVAQNLQEAKHLEFNDTLLWPASKIERGIYGKVEWSF